MKGLRRTAFRVSAWLQGDNATAPTAASSEARARRAHHRPAGTRYSRLANASVVSFAASSIRACATGVDADFTTITAGGREDNACGAPGTTRAAGGLVDAGHSFRQRKDRFVAPFTPQPQIGRKMDHANSFLRQRVDRTRTRTRHTGDASSPSVAPRSRGSESAGSSPLMKRPPCPKQTASTEENGAQKMWVSF